MLAPELVTGPAEPLVPLAEAKAHCRVDHDDDDSLIDGYIAAATAHLDGWSGILGRALVTQVWRQAYCAFGVLRLPLSPVQSVTEVAYTDRDGVEKTVAAADYVLLADGYGSYAMAAPGASWPGDAGAGADAVRVTFAAGYGAPDEVPAAIRQAVLLLVGHWYENREAVAAGREGTVMPKSVDALLAPFRRYRV